MKKLLALSCAFCVCVCLYSGGRLVQIWQKGEKSQNAFSELEKSAVPSTSAQSPAASSSAETQAFVSPYENVFAQNEDMIAWIQIPDTDFRYPVMHTPDAPNYYLRRDFEKNASDYGVPYLAEACSLDRSDNLLVYGHNFAMEKMFGFLMHYRDQRFYQKHPVIVLDTQTETRYYRIFAVSLVTALSEDTDVFPYYNFTHDATQAEYKDYVRNIETFALYDTALSPNGAQLLTLSTCEYSQKNGRLLVCAFLEKTES